jgi:XapX domain-containing protein
MIQKKESRNMHEIFLALLAGIFVGVVFTLLKLPLPAPPVLSGIVGILGILVGSKIVIFITERFFN